ncbi:membrane protein [Peptostreptococcus russellii]|uniref:Membrane protein n=1 Tax=Peptostreptococcus russellii TaxID=215200 RepID=A0A2P7Q2X1_9FIRM|nr:DUF2871 domain-containing protein [Peptostreptococcus russellii]PSJ32306.1 membrane protein [Peptostreptococcus russellii]
MKKYINLSFIYFIFAMIAGVFYREYTKFVGFTDRSSLSLVHGHLLALGMIMFLIVALFSMKFDFENNKKIKLFYKIYNSGVILTAVMLFVRGMVQVNNTVISKGLDASISGISGIGHLLLLVGLVFMFLALKEEAGKLE